MAAVADILRAARDDAQLSQTELAKLAETSQSALARYETGASLPTLPTLERLLSACGQELRLNATPKSQPGSRPSSARSQLGPQARRLRNRRRALLDAAHQYGATRLRVFGSVARGDASADSDVDLLVDLKPGRTLLDLAGFQREAARILDLGVDVATPDLLKDRAREQVLNEAVPI